jgi:predicted GNAT family N-acyltransferase
MPEYRGLGLGRRLVETALGWAAVHGVEISAAIAARGPVGGWRGLVLVHAQVDVERMYAGLGFMTDEGLGRWDEEGIEHVGMFRRIVVE